MFLLVVSVPLPYAKTHGDSNDELALVQGAVRTDLVRKSAAFDSVGSNVATPAPFQSWAGFYESLLPKHVNLAKEHKMWKGSAAQVHVVEEHHQALRWWLRSAISDARTSRVPEQKRRLLLHVDSHEDIGVSTWDDVPRSVAKKGRTSLAQFMSRQADIGSFISAAVAAGLVSDMVWLRSDFSHSKYNGPSPGLYKAGFFLVGKSICQMIIRQDDDLKQEGERRDKLLNIKVDDFNTCEGTNMNNRDPFATFNLLVTDLPHFQQDLDHYLARSGSVPISEWWLDIDEDFFATYVPGWHNLENFLRSEFDADHLRSIRKVLSQLHTACGDEKDMALIKRVRKLPWQEWGNWKSWRKLKCKMNKELKDELMDVTGDLSHRQAKAWDKGIRNLYENDYISGDAFYIFSKQSEMPHGLPSKKELALTFSAFEGSLRHIVKRLGRPKVRTVCRSILNGYLPHKLWKFIEPKLKQTLRHALDEPKLRMVPDAANPSTKLYSGMV